MRKRTSYLPSAFWFVSGSVAGAGLALLFAPHSGTATRERIGRKLRDAVDDVIELNEELVTRGQDIQEEAARLGNEAVSAIAGKAGFPRARNDGEAGRAPGD